MIKSGYPYDITIIIIVFAKSEDIVTFMITLILSPRQIPHQGGQKRLAGGKVRDKK